MNSFDARATFRSGDTDYTIWRLDAMEKAGYDVKRLPYSLRILLENLLRTEDDLSVCKDDIEALVKWDPKADPTEEISFTPARVLLQDFTGVPCVVDLAAMREAMTSLGGDASRINPLQPVELVIDHSFQIDAFGSAQAMGINTELEFERNSERYAFLKWGQLALDDFKVVPPNTGICHQVNLEYLARVAFVRHGDTQEVYPDTLVGTDSHTTMVNGLGVLGWGVGGIEAEAAMLGQPVSMLIPQVIGFKLTGKLREGATSTDLVLRVTEMLRKKGVVGKFVEFYGEGVRTLPLADRATIGNMSPEYGATCGIFPVDEITLDYLRLTGRPDCQVELVEKYFREQGLFYTASSQDPVFSDTLELDLSTVEPSVAGPKRPQDRAVLSDAAKSFTSAFPDAKAATVKPAGAGVAVLEKPSIDQMTHGAVVIASITSCTNTSNPSVMVAAGLVARNAAKLGIHPKPWVKTSLAPGSRVVTEYLKKAGLLDDLEQIGFNVVGYGCATCIGNSGPLPDEVSKEIAAKDLVAVSVLSGNRNFEGRIHQEVRANYLMSPPLVVAYALAGTILTDITKDSIGKDRNGGDVFLKDVWPTQAEVARVMGEAVSRDLYQKTYAKVYDGGPQWNAIDVTGSKTFDWNRESTYIKNPPYFEGMAKQAPTGISELTGMRCLAMLGDSITTDHISPAGAIKLSSPAGSYLTAHGVDAKMFNSYGSRRGNHEVMVRGTFANIRLRNELVPGTEGGFTVYFPTNEKTTIYDAAMQYKGDGTPLIVIGGKEYGSGSSRDWAAKGTFMLGIKAVVAESFERIHRSNLIGMGVLPLEFLPGEGRQQLGLTGEETFDLIGLSHAAASEFGGGRLLEIQAGLKDTVKSFKVRVRIDTPQELLYYRHGGILQFVLRQLIGTA